MAHELNFTVDISGTHRPIKPDLYPSEGPVQAASLTTNGSAVQGSVQAASLNIGGSGVRSMEDSVQAVSIPFFLGSSSSMNSFDPYKSSSPHDFKSDPFFSSDPARSGSSEASYTRRLVARITPEGDVPSSAANVPSSAVKTLRVYHQYGPRSARQYDLTAAQQATLQGHYQDLKGALGVPADATHFSVNFTLQTASYRNANGKNVTVPIDGNIPAFRQASALLRKEVYGGHFQHAHFNNNTEEKGSHNGPKALVRPEQSRVAQFPRYTPPGSNNPAREQMKEYAVQLCVTPETQAKAQKRIDDVEKVLDGMHTGVQDSIHEIKKLQEASAKQQHALITERGLILQLEQPDLSEEDEDRLEEINGELDAVRGEIKVLEERLQEKEEELKEIEKIDIYALYTALALYPEAHDPEQVRAAADQLYKIIKRETEERINTSRSRFANFPLIGRFFREDELKKHKKYAADVAGLLFAGLGVEGREPYAHYCNARKIPMKGQAEEDSLFYSVINHPLS